MKIGKLGVIALVMTGLMIMLTPPLRAADEKAPAAAPAPKTYAEAVKQIQDHMKSIDTAIKAGKVKDTHPDAEAIITLSKSLGELALADKSGVAKDKVKEVNKASKDLAEMTDSFHDAADAGKTEEAKKHYDHMVELVKTISDNVKG